MHTHAADLDLPDLFDGRGPPYAARHALIACEGVGPIMVRVGNDGCTLAPGDAGRVFDRFWPGQPVPRRRSGGTVLGLPLTRKLLAAMAGRIDAAVDGQRFEVAIVLPRA